MIILAPRAGMSLVEVIVAMLILTLGVLAVAATTGFIFAQLRDASATAGSATAVQDVVERLRATPFDQIASRPENQAETVGRYRVWWTARPTENLVELEVVVEGPGGTRAGGADVLRRDTVVTSIVRP